MAPVLQFPGRAEKSTHRCASHLSRNCFIRLLLLVVVVVVVVVELYIKTLSLSNDKLIEFL